MAAFAEKEKKEEKTPKPSVLTVKETADPTPAIVNDTVQRDLSDVNGPEGGMLPGDVSAKIQSKRGTGQRLSDKQNQFYSQKFGRDMSDVHVHTDTESDTISRSLNARAFTIGSDVFLTKGINPEGGGRDAQTMTHELTHVVQQGGHASSGPLKLGAADTAQEHEAESTAMREYSPEMKEEEDTIQRGFWWDLGSAIGTKLLSAVGLNEAYDDFMGGDKKVKAAIEKLDQAKQNRFNTLNTDIKRLEKNELNRAKAEVDEAQRAYDTQLSTTLNNQTSGANPAPQEVDETDLNQKTKAYEDLYSNYEEKKKQLLELIHEADDSITQEDLDRYNSGTGTFWKGFILGAIGGKILSAFESDPEKKQAVREKGVKSINDYFSSNKKLKEKVPEAKKHMVRRGGFLHEAVTLESQTKKMIETAYEEALKQEENKMIVPPDKNTFVKEIYEDKDFSDIKKRIRKTMADTVHAPGEGELETAEARFEKISELRTKYNVQSLSTEYQRITDRLNQLDAQDIPAAQQAVAGGRNKKQARNNLRSLQTEKNQLGQKKTELETDTIYQYDTDNYENSGKKIDDFIEEKKNSVETFLADPKNVSGLVGDNTFTALQAEVETFLNNKISGVKDTENRRRSAMDDTKKKDEIIKAAWEKVQKSKELKGKYSTWLMFRRTVLKEFSDMIMDGYNRGESKKEMVDAVIEGVTLLAEKKEEKK